MANNKIKKCKHCGAEIAKSAKVCPVCGGKNKKPIYKRVWFWLLVIIIILVKAWNSIPDAPNESAEQRPIEYIEVTADQMYDELNENALNAEEKYDDAYVAVTGRLSTIDSDGSYISVASDNYALDSIMCYIKSEEQLEKVRSLSHGDIVTVKGKIREVGEVMGYSMDIDSIE